MKYLSNLATYQIAFNLVLYIYLSFFYDPEPENGSGCYTYTNSEGRLVAKCSIESAACYTKGWPASIQTGHAAQLCTETVSPYLLHYSIYTNARIANHQMDGNRHCALRRCASACVSAYGDLVFAVHDA